MYAVLICMRGIVPPAHPHLGYFLKMYTKMSCIFIDLEQIKDAVYQKAAKDETANSKSTSLGQRKSQSSTKRKDTKFNTKKWTIMDDNIFFFFIFVCLICLEG